MAALNHIRLLLATVALLLCAAPAAFGQGSVRDAIFADCEADDRIDGAYTEEQLLDARSNLPADLRDYTRCLDAIDVALLQASQQGTGQAQGGGGGSSGGGSSSGGSGGSGSSTAPGASAPGATSGPSGSFVSPPSSPPPTASAPPSVQRLFIQPFPTVRIAGRLTATGARLRVVSVTAPIGARVDARCVRGTCRGRRVRRRVGRSRTLRLRPFERTLRAGTVITVAVSSPGRIGKHMRFTVRRGAAPTRQDRCLATNGRRAIACPSA